VDLFTVSKYLREKYFRNSEVSDDNEQHSGVLGLFQRRHFSETGLFSNALEGVENTYSVG
jgi:hypothetical protein